MIPEFGICRFCGGLTKMVVPAALVLILIRKMPILQLFLYLAKQTPNAMLTRDRLWKAIWEDFFPQAILFYFPAFYPQIDWAKGFEILDKELRELLPESVVNERRADLLVKVWLLDGTERWMLIHVEIQGYKDDEFPRRMFTYYYRITDRFGMPVSALAVLTDNNKNWRPDRYEVKFMGTELVYKYPVFKLMDYTEKDFEGNPNPWAIVMKAALIGLKGNWTDEALLEAKVSLYREMRAKGYSDEQVRNLLQFLKYNVRFRKKKFFRKFDDEREKIDNIKNLPMGIAELVKEHLLEEAKEEGREEGMEKGELKKAIVGIRNMLLKKYTISDIAGILDVPKELVIDFEKQLKKEQQIIDELEKGKLGIEMIAQKLKVHSLLAQVIADLLK